MELQLATQTEFGGGALENGRPRGFQTFVMTGDAIIKTSQPAQKRTPLSPADSLSPDGKKRASFADDTDVSSNDNSNTDASPHSENRLESRQFIPGFIRLEGDRCHLPSRKSKKRLSMPSPTRSPKKTFLHSTSVCVPSSPMTGSFDDSEPQTPVREFGEEVGDQSQTPSSLPDLTSSCDYNVGVSLQRCPVNLLDNCPANELDRCPVNPVEGPANPTSLEGTTITGAPVEIPEADIQTLQNSENASVAKTAPESSSNCDRNETFSLLEQANKARLYVKSNSNISSLMLQQDLACERAEGSLSASLQPDTSQQRGITPPVAEENCESDSVSAAVTDLTENHQKPELCPEDAMVEPVMAYQNLAETKDSSCSIHRLACENELERELQNDIQCDTAGRGDTVTNCDSLVQIVTQAMNPEELLMQEAAVSLHAGPMSLPITVCDSDDVTLPTESAVVRHARRLYLSSDIKQDQVLAHLIKKDDYSHVLATEYLKHFDFTGAQLVDSLRKLCARHSVQIGRADHLRILLPFARRFYQCNSESSPQFVSEEACHYLVCALLSLNASLHSQNSGPKMTLHDFMDGLRGLNTDCDFPVDLLKYCYLSIFRTPLTGNQRILRTNISTLRCQTIRQLPAATCPVAGQRAAELSAAETKASATHLNFETEPYLRRYGSARMASSTTAAVDSSAATSSDAARFSEERLTSRVAENDFNRTVHNASVGARRYSAPGITPSQSIDVDSAPSAAATENSANEAAHTVKRDYIKRYHQNTVPVRRSNSARSATPDSPPVRGRYAAQSVTAASAEVDMISLPNRTSSFLPSFHREAVADTARSVQNDARSGYLLRKHCKESAGVDVRRGRRSWQQQYAVCRGLQLFLLKNDKSLTTEPATKTLPIYHSVAKPLTQHKKKKWVFTLTLADGSQYMFSCNEESECSSWVNFINAAAASMSAPSMGLLDTMGGARFYRPSLPSSVCTLQPHEQLHSHQSRLKEFQARLRKHKENQPTKHAKQHQRKNYDEKLHYLLSEVDRYSTYIDLLLKQNRCSANSKPVSKKEIKSLLPMGINTNSPTFVRNKRGSYRSAVIDI